MRAARMFVKTWRILTELRTDPARATNLLRALLVLANLVVNRSRPGTAAHQLHEHLSQVSGIGPEMPYRRVIGGALVPQGA